MKKSGTITEVAVKLFLLAGTAALLCWCGYMRYMYGHITFPGLSHAYITRADDFALIVYNNEYKPRTNYNQFVLSSQSITPKDKKTVYKFISNINKERQSYAPTTGNHSGICFDVQCIKPNMVVSIGTSTGEWNTLSVRCSYTNEWSSSTVEQKWYEAPAEELEQFVNHMLDQVDTLIPPQ